MTAWLLVVLVSQVSASAPGCEITIDFPASSDFPDVVEQTKVTGYVRLPPDLYLWVFSLPTGTGAGRLVGIGLPAALDAAASARGFSGTWGATARFQSAPPGETRLSSILVMAVDEITNSELIARRDRRRRETDSIDLTEVNPRCHITRTDWGRRRRAR